MLAGEKTISIPLTPHLQKPSVQGTSKEQKNLIPVHFPENIQIYRLGPFL
jgi:hypothetical protein